MPRAADAPRVLAVMGGLTGQRFGRGEGAKGNVRNNIPEVLMAMALRKLADAG